MPESPDNKEKSHPLGVVRFLDTEHDAKGINAFGLLGKKLWLFECYWNLNEFEKENKGGGVMSKAYSPDAPPLIPLRARNEWLTSGPR